MLTRRTLFQLLAATPGALPPVRALTKGPQFHWFGYYDKLQFDPESRYVLGNEIEFEHRSPAATDVIRIGMIDLRDNDLWTTLGETRAWNWQQGCMLQWLPGSSTEVIYNDRQDGQYVSHILDVRSGKRRTLPGPVYAISPDAKWAVSPDFSRLNDMRPGYGYAGIPDPYFDELAPEKTGIWRMNLQTGKRDLILSFKQIAAVPYKLADWTGSKHKVNHLLFSPDGSRFIFLHRRRGGAAKNPEAGGTRMFTCKPDGTDLYVLDPYGDTSHFIWRDPRACAGLGAASFERQSLLSVPGQVGGSVRSWRRRDDGERPLHVSAGQSLDPQRHVSRPRAEAERLPVRSRDEAGACRWAIFSRRRSTRASGVATRIRDSARTGRW